MTARLGCAYIITRLRVMIDDKDSATWTDAELQDLIDDHRTFVAREQLNYHTFRIEGGTTSYSEAFSRWGWYEETTGGTARFILRDTGGTIVDVGDYTPNYVVGQVTFGDNQQGSARYLTGYRFDVHAAAADAWRDQAGVTAAFVQFQSGNVRISRNQWHEHCKAMALVHAGLSEPVVVEMWTDGDR